VKYPAEKAFWYRGQDANHILIKEKFSQKEGDGLHGKLCRTDMGAENRQQNRVDYQFNPSIFCGRKKKSKITNRSKII
jgi:hypothetical protein